MILTARNLLNPNSTATRLLRIRILDENDNVPEFVQGSNVMFPVPVDKVVAGTVVGRLSATDADSDDFGIFQYNLMPRCNPEYTPRFSIDMEGGEVSIKQDIPAPIPDKIELCAFVSEKEVPELRTINFDANNASMTRFTIMIDKPKRQIVAPMMLMNNNSVTVADQNFSSLRVPVNNATHKNVHFEQSAVTFVPAAFAIPNNVELAGLFDVKTETGDARAQPELADQQQGVYTINVNARDAVSNEDMGTYQQKFHLIHDEMKLKYVFDMNPDHLSQNFLQFQGRIQDALRAQEQAGVLSIQLDKPKAYGVESNRSSACFHVTRNDVILDETSSVALISDALHSDSELATLYHVYKIVNIEKCLASPVPTAAASTSILPPWTLLLICAVLILTLILCTLCTYCCFVQRYKDYLRNKEKNMKADALPYKIAPLGSASQFIVPQIMPPPPAFY